MDIVRKDASITNTDEDFPGSFEVVLSSPTLDRDGDTYLPDEWKMPLPEHITFDTDHGLSVSATVGSGRPSLNEKGQLVVSGTYSSLPRAQEVRTLVKEGHINRTSVAVLNGKKTLKDGSTAPERELLNGSFVSVPANREAVILSSKALAVKAGARNSKTDQEHLNALAGHLAAATRHTVALGAVPEAGDDPQGGDTSANADVSAAKGLRAAKFKSIAGSLEAAQDRVRDALTDANPDAGYVFLRGTVPDGNGGGYAVFGVEPKDGPWTEDLFQQSYTDSGSVVTLVGDPKPVDLTEVVTSDPDEDADTAADSVPAPAAAKAAPGAATKSAPVEDHSIDQQLMAARKRFYATLNEGN